MPAYDYRCNNCHALFLVELSYEDVNNKELEVACPDCCSLDVKRLVNKGVNIIYKGDGFYNTDNKTPQK